MLAATNWFSASTARTRRGAAVLKPPPTQSRDPTPQPSSTLTSTATSTWPKSPPKTTTTTTTWQNQPMGAALILSVPKPTSGVRVTATACRCTCAATACTTARATRTRLDATSTPVQVSTAAEPPERACTPLTCVTAGPSARSVTMSYSVTWPAPRTARATDWRSSAPASLQCSCTRDCATWTPGAAVCRSTTWTRIGCWFTWVWPDVAWVTWVTLHCPACTVWTSVTTEYAWSRPVTWEAWSSSEFFSLLAIRWLPSSPKIPPSLSRPRSRRCRFLICRTWKCQPWTSEFCHLFRAFRPWTCQTAALRSCCGAAVPIGRQAISECWTCVVVPSPHSQGTSLSGCLASARCRPTTSSCAARPCCRMDSNSTGAQRHWMRFPHATLSLAPTLFGSLWICWLLRRCWATLSASWYGSWSNAPPASQAALSSWLTCPWPILGWACTWASSVLRIGCTGACTCGKTPRGGTARCARQRGFCTRSPARRPPSSSASSCWTGSWRCSCPCPYPRASGYGSAPGRPTLPPRLSGEVASCLLLFRFSLHSGNSTRWKERARRCPSRQEVSLVVRTTPWQSSPLSTPPSFFWSP